MKACRIILAVLICAVMLTVSSCVKYSSFDDIVTSSESTTAYQYIEGMTQTLNEQTTSVVIPEITTSAIIPETTTAVIVTEVNTTAAPVTVITTSAPKVESTTNAPAPDYASYTKGQIIDVYAAAIQKTRSYKGNVTVNHSESFTANIKEAYPGGALTELLASNIVKLVGSEGQQTLNFRNGYATNKDNETVPLLLPQRTAFSLPEQGVASAQISSSGGKTRVKIVLVPETVSMGQVPTYNASAIGYLDTSDMEFKIISISRVDISYPGSVIDAVINSEGFIESVTYTINMSTYAELSGMGITGHGTLEGAQTETWKVNW